MRITSKSKISLDCMLEIGAHTARGYAISIPAVARRLGVSRSYLEIAFSNLKSAGLIISHRGPGGGYSLAAAPENISVKDVVNATQDSHDEIQGLSAQLWLELDSYMQTQMSQISLAHLIDKSAIRIESISTRPITELADKQKRPSSSISISTPKQIKKQFGPNSVFAFGKYLANQ